MLKMLTKPSGMRDLRQIFEMKPISLHKTYPAKNAPMLWPKVIRDAYATLWSGKHSRVIIKAPRGGGKSKLLGTFGFDRWYLKNLSVVNMAGSEAQATIVYNYFQDYCEIDGTVLNHIIGGQRGLKIGETENILGKKFICVAASPKSVRGKHEDTLLQDETVEIMDELILAALPIVNQSKQPLIVMASTFHKIFCAVAMGCSDLIVIGNALRLLRWRI